MVEIDEAKLQEKYSQQWRDLKQLLVARHFAGQECKQVYTVENVQVREFEEPPLEKFVTAPRLREDLAKYLEEY
ncbi:hypothetical protein COCOBI_16-0220 [Coccomyxa sp. Obi]|nr:hypothetical protein COCOBI_16-0220 [Coccomyxa sp. Obi]